MYRKLFGAPSITVFPNLLPNNTGDGKRPFPHSSRLPIDTSLESSVYDVLQHTHWLPGSCPQSNIQLPVSNGQLDEALRTVPTRYGISQRVRSSPPDLIIGPNALTLHAVVHEGDGQRWSCPEEHQCQFQATGAHSVVSAIQGEVEADFRV